MVSTSSSGLALGVPRAPRTAWQVLTLSMVVLAMATSATSAGVHAQGVNLTADPAAQAILSPPSITDLVFPTATAGWAATEYADPARVARSSPQMTGDVTGKRNGRGR